MITQKTYDDLRHSLNQCLPKTSLQLITTLGNVQKAFDLYKIKEAWVDGVSIAVSTDIDEINTAIAQDVIKEKIQDGRLVYRLTFRGMWVYYILDQYIYKFERERDGVI